MRIPDVDSLFEKVDITKYPVKKFIAIPLIILLIAFAVLAYTQVSIDSPVRLGTDFKGGTVVKVVTGESQEALEARFAVYPVSSVRDASGENEKSIEFGQMSDSQKDELIATLQADYGSYELRDISPLFGEELQQQAKAAVVVAFILMAIVVLVVFRAAIPPLAVIFAAFSNIVVALACMNVVGLELSLGTVAALLMLIGYSVDSNILLTTNLLRKKGDLNEKVRNTMKTGVTMTFTTFAAMFAMFFVSSTIHLFSAHFAPIPILRDISLVILFGLVMDLMNTWLFNAGVLRWYLEQKESKKYGKRAVKSGATKKKNAKKTKNKSSTV
jgi:preprotein translocase subunit SecF